MNMQIFLYFSLFTLTCNVFMVTNAQPLFGKNVRYGKKSQFRYVVSIMRIPDLNNPPPQINHICTGSLITLRDVATAAHCVSGQNKNSLKVLAGSVDLRRSESYHILWWITYDDWIIHNNMHKQFEDNDVVNLRIDQPVRNSMVPIKMGDFPNMLLYGREVVVGGWSDLFREEVNTLFQFADLTVVPFKDCQLDLKLSLNGNIELHELQSLCTVANPVVLLHYGDTGGPIVFEDKLVGINKGINQNSIGAHLQDTVNIHMSMNYYKSFFEAAIAMDNL